MVILDSLRICLLSFVCIIFWWFWDSLFDFSANYCHLAHTYSQANQSVDCLAGLGSQEEEELIVTTNVPIAAREFGAYSYLVYRFGIYLACIPIWYDDSLSRL